MIGLWLCAGGAVGAFNALILWWTIACLRPESAGRALVGTWGGALVRLAAASGVLAVALRQGIVPGLLVFVGLWLTRWVVAGCSMLERE
ncbi:MAG: hypothetical protein NUW24_02615 [Anaerolineae bacterium]|jgi:hypothetical protein|nr:hypothetical protein [Anaerolineae bacterium]MDH7474235.1 hypothetical protein [Anaerolineae bacterium]